jgi:hypothetical protein
MIMIRPMMSLKSLYRTLTYAKLLFLLTILSVVSAQSLATDLPSGYISCALDGGTCRIRSGAQPIAYYGVPGSNGGPGQFVSVQKTANFACTPASFGNIDPRGGTAKSCYIPIAAAAGPGGTGSPTVTALPTQSSPLSYTICTEGALCSATDNWTGYYGAPGSNGAPGSYAPIAGNGTFTCSLANLNIPDPAPRVAKSCYVLTQTAQVVPTGSNTLVPLPATGYKACATDGEVCRVTGAWNGYYGYGAGAQYAPITGSGEFICLPSTFNIRDPAQGYVKTCYVNNAAVTPAPPRTETSLPLGFVACAQDGQVCDAIGDWTVYYGVTGAFVTRQGSGPFTCLPGDLGVDDPKFGTQKTCYVSQSARTVNTRPQTGFPSCTTDFNTCNRTGAWEGYYGVANGSTFVKIRGTGSFVCLPSTFNITDPAPGSQKTCFVANASTNPAPPRNASTTPTATTNCNFQLQSGTTIYRYAANDAQCSCACAAIGARQGSCTFQSRRINQPVCAAGQYP